MARRLTLTGPELRHNGIVRTIMLLHLREWDPQGYETLSCRQLIHSRAVDYSPTRKRLLIFAVSSPIINSGIYRGSARI